tara:strand:- start:750 stop:2108 length:1359 start_codon:yes stop_codon:yes gene_type:complete
MLLLLINFYLICAYSYHNKVGIPKIIKNSLYVASENECKTSIILFPGFGKNGKSYTGLCNKISAKLNNSVSFMLIDYGLNSPFNIERHANYIGETCVEYMKTKNKKCNNFVFMGHSVGGYFAIEPAEKYGDGLVQMGCVFNSKKDILWQKKKSLKTYQKPVLTLLGEKDGYINYLNSIQEFDSITEDDFLKKPIILKKNVNHLQMCDDKESKAAKLMGIVDYDSHLNIDAAHDILSDSIVKFIKKNETILNEVKESCKKINEYKKLNFKIDDVCNSVQNYVFNGDDNSIVKTKNIKHKNLNDFLISKPVIDENGTVEVQSFEKKNLNQLYSKSLWIKTKNQKALLNHPIYVNIRVGEEMLASEINKQIFENEVNDMCMLNVNFEEEVFNGEQPLAIVKWLSKDVEVKYKNNILTIKSPVLYTDESILERYSGMKYMKLLTPQMVSEIRTLYY